CPCSSTAGGPPCVVGVASGRRSIAPDPSCARPSSPSRRSCPPCGSAASAERNPMAIRLGMQAKLYFKVGGVAATGPWTELGNVKDLTLSLETGEADVTTRANAGWRATVGTLKAGSPAIAMIWDTADPGVTAIKDAFLGNTAIGLAAMDGDLGTSGSQGLHADCSIISFSRSEALEEAITVSVSAKPTYSTTAPAWVTVA